MGRSGCHPNNSESAPDWSKSVQNIAEPWRKRPILQLGIDLPQAFSDPIKLFAVELRSGSLAELRAITTGRHSHLRLLSQCAKNSEARTDLTLGPGETMASCW